MLWCLVLFGLGVLGAPTIPSAASFYVQRLPGLDASRPLHIYSGHLSSDPNASDDVSAHLFFIMVKNRRVADKERLMFWFNGGPGCSSFDGVMMENGPWRMNGNSALRTVDGGWEEYTTMVYIDQPAGTGFSYAPTDGYVHGLDAASVQLVEFLKNFYKVFPELYTVDTYLGGESYAGQYIPYFANAILDHLPIPLRGAAIGNGWIDVRRQYPSFLEYSVRHGLIEENSAEWKEAKKATDECMANPLFSDPSIEPISVSGCEHLLTRVLSNKARKVDGVDMCVNIYDVRLEDTSPSCGMNWPPEIHNVTTYLDRQDVVSALHAESKSEAWVECRGRIHQELQDWKSNSSITILPRVLERIPVLLFAGDRDYICNYVGQEALIKAMTWNGQQGLGTVQTQSWSVDGNPAGTWVSSRNLTYVKIFNASHMAPFDMPLQAHDMILRFMNVNFTAISDGTARIPSSIGTQVKPVISDSQSAETPVSSKTPEQDKAMWEAYYNAGSVVFVVVLIAVGVSIFTWCRLRKRNAVALDTQDPAESIPLTRSEYTDEDEFRGRSRKGKERALEPPVFDVGEMSEDEDR